MNDPVSGACRPFVGPVPDTGPPDVADGDRSGERDVLRRCHSDPFDRWATGGVGVDPVSASLLAAVATGAGGEVGRQLWETLRGLVRRGSTDEAAESQDSITGAEELSSLSAAPHDMERAQALSEALSRRADQDPSFRVNLMQWHQQAQLMRTGDGDTANTVSGGTQHGPVVQGRDFSGINFHAPGS